MSNEPRTELWAIDICEHGWSAPHCIRDSEGSCPFEHDRRNPAADCRCDAAGMREATYDDVWWWLADYSASFARRETP